MFITSLALELCLPSVERSGFHRMVSANIVYNVNASDVVIVTACSKLAGSMCVAELRIGVSLGLYPFIGTTHM